MTVRTVIKFALFLTITLALSAIRTKADVINFDNLAAGVTVTNQYPQVVFSSTAGFVNVTVGQNLGTSLPNFICTRASGGGQVDCAHETILDFTSPVNNLSFLAVGVNNTGVVAVVDVFQNNVFSTSVNVIGQGTIAPVPVNLPFNGITRVRIHDITDLVGIGWDDFTFNQTAPASVPEPTTLTLLGSGLVSMVFKLRRRRSR